MFWRKKKPRCIRIYWGTGRWTERYALEAKLLEAGATLLWGGPGGDYAICETKAIANKAGSILGGKFNWCGEAEYKRVSMFPGPQSRATGEMLLQGIVKKASAPGRGR